MMMELGKLAVDELFTVEEIVTVVENMCMIPEERLIKQPDTHRNRPYNSLSKQTLTRFKDPALTQMLTQEDPALTQKLAQEDPALEQMLARGNQLLPTESQLPKNEEEVPDSTSDLQMTTTSTAPFRERGAPTLQGGQHDRHQRDEGRGYTRGLRKPDPTLQVADDPMNDTAKVNVDVNDNPMDEMNADQSSTTEETDTKTQGEETSTKLGGGFVDDRTALVTIQDEIVKLRAKMIMLETSQSNLLTRFLELDTKPPSPQTQL
jgi:hypothetical protein